METVPTRSCWPYPGPLRALSLPRESSTHCRRQRVDVSLPTSGMPCSLRSAERAAGLKNSSRAESPPSHRSPSAKERSNGISGFWLHLPSCHHASSQRSLTAAHQPISPSLRWRRPCPTPGPSKNAGSVSRPADRQSCGIREPYRRFESLSLRQQPVLIRSPRPAETDTSPTTAGLCCLGCGLRFHPQAAARSLLGLFSPKLWTSLFSTELLTR